MRGEDGPVVLASISERQKISCPIWSSCSATAPAMLVDSVRGPGGGYRIARPLDQVWWPISSALWMSNLTLRNGGRENCYDEHRCMTHDPGRRWNIKMLNTFLPLPSAELEFYRENLKHVGTAVMEDQRCPGRSRVPEQAATNSAAV